MCLDALRLKTIYYATVFINVCWSVFNSQGIEDPCNFDFNGKCVSKVTCNFGDKNTEKREFTISCIDQQHNGEIIGDCGWQSSGDLNCDTADGYACKRQLNNSVSVTITDASACGTCREIVFDVTGEDPVKCTVPLNRTGASDYRDELTSQDTATSTERGKSLETGLQGIKNNSTQNGSISREENAEDGADKDIDGGSISAIVIALLTVAGVTAVVIWKRQKIVDFVTKKRNKRPAKEITCPADSQDKTMEAKRFLDFQLPVENAEVIVTCSSELHLPQNRTELGGIT